MFFMTPMDLAALTLRNAAQIYALQAQMAETFLSLARQQSAAMAPAGAPVAPMAMGICGPARLSLVKPAPGSV